MPPPDGRLTYSKRSTRGRNRMHSIYFNFSAHNRRRRNATSKRYSHGASNSPRRMTHRIQARAPDEAGIDGGMGAIQNARICEGTPVTLVTIAVVDLGAFIARVIARRQCSGAANGDPRHRLVCDLRGTGRIELRHAARRPQRTMTFPSSRSLRFNRHSPVRLLSPQPNRVDARPCYIEEVVACAGRPP